MNELIYVVDEDSAQTEDIAYVIDSGNEAEWSEDIAYVIDSEADQRAAD